MLNPVFPILKRGDKIRLTSEIRDTFGNVYPAGLRGIISQARGRTMGLVARHGYNFQIVAVRFEGFCTLRTVVDESVEVLK